MGQYIKQMNMIKITFPDNSVKEFEAGTTPLQIAQSISPRLAREVLAATVDGQEWDLTRPISADASLKLFKWEDAEGKHAFWHSSAHLLAEALQELYPGVRFGIGPAIENGFYYDIDPGEHKLTADDFAKIEAKMLELARLGQQIVRADISKADALKLFGDRNEEYKCELISELPDGSIRTHPRGARPHRGRASGKDCRGQGQGCRCKGRTRGRCRRRRCRTRRTQSPRGRHQQGK